MVSKKQFARAVDKFRTDLAKSKFKEYVKADLQFNVGKALFDLYYENQILKISLETIRKVLISKKITNKNEIDALIDELVIKKAKFSKKR